MRYEAYSYADKTFYDSPVRWATSDEFDAVGEPLPAGWVGSAREVWVGRTPASVELPDQGWKIHVSACLDNAEHILSVVSAYCVQHDIAYKFLRSPALVQTQNAKYASRGSSGKFMTLYPVDETQLERSLNDLDEALAGQRGPYILSDLRWRNGPLYLRYGGFTEQFCRSESGELVLALREPSGRLRPDVRRAVFEVPDWAPVPAVLAQALADRAATSMADFPYTVERALHFSNGGGIYLARHVSGGDHVVLKEARPDAGLDQRGDDAVSRLVREHDIMRRLEGVPCVPAALDHLTAWEHHFLVQEYIAGEPLNKWFGRRYPLIHPDPGPEEIERFRDEALDILAKIEEGLRAIHARGIVFGDLHPRNLIVRPDGRVCFVDFELASPADDFVRPGLGAAGFAAPADLAGYAIDDHALDALRLWIFMPLIQLTALDPGKRDQLAHAARRRFALPGTAEHGLPRVPPPTPAASSASPPPPHGETDFGRLAALFSGDRADWPALRDSLAAAISASATPERSDRLFPGDPSQFTHDGLGLAYGAAGVLWALHTVGVPVAGDHVEWLLEAVARRPCRPGLYTGAHGVAFALDRLGHVQQAHNLLDRLLKEPLDSQGSDLAGGLPGIGLTLLHFAGTTSDASLRAVALDVAQRLADRLPTEGARPAAGTRPGLLHGPTGSALLFLSLYDSTGDTALLDLAERALRLDLARCVLGDDGTLQVDEGSRVLPYLESGSAGIAAVLHTALRHRPDPERQRDLERIRLAAEPEFIVQPGLFNGRAGLILLLHLLGDGTRDDDPMIRRHIRRLVWHLIPHQGHAAFPGEQLLRLSMDLATGSAGVMLALGSALADTPALPFWTGRPAAAPAPPPTAQTQTQARTQAPAQAPLHAL
ncbi:class III lanthionine synthetase LanKC [Streptomyces heilongjiangensis]|uniref:Class III lanthionine synthetase LanKC n=1 Tax=Streptomyces heilongjiangensis TaxID=945052 RepID=A0ABW1AZK4_9ACTN|nr:class III lanthionine synthetase LanKC [Streptomyces heilongjiangensis]MDC2946486.1 class III lanthionine synthetase LanKC [Streptomyces heilongjiangensis]